MKRIKPVVNSWRRISDIKYLSRNTNSLRYPTLQSECRRPLSVILQNMRSVRNKAVAMHEQIVDCNVDIALLTETWLKETDSSVINDLTPPGYSYLGMIRVAKAGGGIGILHKDEIIIKVRQSPTMSTFEHLVLQSKYTCIIILYRLPDTDMKFFLQEFGDVLGEISSVPGNLIIAGDFNIYVDNSKREGVTEFAQILDQHELEQNVVGVTHKRGHNLDLVITRQGEDTVRDVHIVNRHISDHYSIDFNIFSCHHLSRNMDGEIFRRNFRDIDISTLKNSLMVNINKETDSDADTIIESYMNAVETTLDELCKKNGGN